MDGPEVGRSLPGSQNRKDRGQDSEEQSQPMSYFAPFGLCNGDTKG